MTFVEFARTHGLEIDRLRSGDRIFRCPTTAHPRSRNGAYAFDGKRGWVQNWETGEALQWWNDPTARPWSEAEKRDWERKRQRDAAERAALAKRAADEARELIESATMAPHNYLTAKGLDARGLVTPDYVLVVPMRGIDDGQLRGAQTIALVENQWRKKFVFGTRAKGAVLRIGPARATESYLVEGYATGLSVEAAARRLCLSAAVYVTFSADNLAHVAPLIRGRRYVIADNDQSGTGQRVAEATGLPWVMSDRVGNDANDDHVQFGLLSVCKLLMRARSDGGRAV